MPDSKLTPEQAAQKEALVRITHKKKWTCKDIQKLYLLPSAFFRLEREHDMRLYNLFTEERISALTIEEQKRCFDSDDVKRWVFQYSARAGMLVEGITGVIDALDRQLSFSMLAEYADLGEAPEYARADMLEFGLDVFSDPEIGANAMGEVNLFYSKYAYALQELSGYNCVIQGISNAINAPVFNDGYAIDLSENIPEYVEKINAKIDRLRQIVNDSPRLSGMAKKRKIYSIDTLFPHLAPPLLQAGEAGENRVKRVLSGNFARFEAFNHEALYNIGAASNENSRSKN